MALISLIDAELAFGLHPLLDGASFSLEAGERVGLIGRNGTGKSSLLRAITGEEALSGGEIRVQSGVRLIAVEQEPQLPVAASLRESLALRGRIADIDDERARWSTFARLDEFLQRFDLDATRTPASASGGERKRAALALSMALSPDVLLLDEPTNHLDIGAIELLEQLLAKGPACIVVTHDRRFLDNVVTRIVELDRGRLRSYPGDFTAYENAKAHENAVEDAAHRRFEKFWAQEEAWIRQGVKARRTRNEGRVRRLEALRTARAERRSRLGSVRMSIDTGERSGKLVIELEGVSKRYGPHTVVDGLDLRIMRGDRLGLIGGNGAGKSTLLGMMMGTIAPDAGSVRLGTGLSIAYFDQMREQLDPERTVGETISPGSEWVEINGTRKHVASYLGDFLFAPERARARVKSLSGGERNRLLLARLFARPANLLVLDEPTNDLDIDTLDLLEELLQEYGGTLLLVSHDRAFLDNVITQSLVAEGDGRWQEYVGGYSDWLRQRPAPTPQPERPAVAAPPRRDEGERNTSKVKLSYKEVRELDAIPQEIALLEAEQRELHARMGSDDYFRQPADTLRADAARVAEIESLLMERLERWETLEARRRDR